MSARIVVGYTATDAGADAAALGARLAAATAASLDLVARPRRRAARRGAQRHHTARRRLRGRHRLDTVATEMLHELPVPMVVVPRTRDHDSKNGAR